MSNGRCELTTVVQRTCYPCQRIDRPRQQPVQSRSTQRVFDSTRAVSVDILQIHSLTLCCPHGAMMALDPLTGTASSGAPPSSAFGDGVETCASHPSSCWFSLAAVRWSMSDARKSSVAWVSQRTSRGVPGALSRVIAGSQLQDVSTRALGNNRPADTQSYSMARLSCSGHGSGHSAQSEACIERREGCLQVDSGRSFGRDHWHGMRAADNACTDTDQTRLHRKRSM